MEKMKIEKGIRVPERHDRKGNSLTGRIARQMEVGDSVWLETRQQAHALYAMITRVYGPGAATQRKLGKSGFRVWRVE